MGKFCLLGAKGKWGLIRLRSSPPPRLQGVEYVLNVTATDDNASGGPHPLSSSAQVVVGVDDVNNNKPVFEKRPSFSRSHRGEERVWESETLNILPLRDGVDSRAAGL
ncbi:neural-cadherin-like [Arapaima gigas]